MTSQVSGYIGRINPGDGTNYAIGSTAYGKCDTTAATTEKVVDMTGFTLVTGATIFVKFTYANTAANPTLNVNGTGAKRIYLYGTTSVLPNSSNYMFWNANAVCVFTYDGSAWMLGDGEEKTWLLAESCLYHDLWAFGRKSNMPTYEYSLDGTSWTSATLPDGAKKLFACKENITYQIINDTTPYVRLTWLNGNLHSCSATYIAMGCAWSSPHATVSIQLEANTNTGSDGLTNPTWTVLSIHTGISANGSAQFFKLTNAVSGNKGLRFTIWRTSATGTMPVSTLKLLTTRWGDQGGGSELSYPFDWDENANVFPIANNSKLLGTSSTRWKELHTYDTYDYNIGTNKLVKTDANCKLVAATAGTDYATTDEKVKDTAGNGTAYLLGHTTQGTTATAITNSAISMNSGTLTVGNLIDSGLTANKWVKTDANKQLVTVDAPSDTNYYHSTGTWSGLTYTASNNGGNSCPDLALTIPTGSTSTTVALGNHGHGNIQSDGTLQTNDVAIATGDKLVVTDSSDSSKVARTSVAFDITDSRAYLSHDGQWRTPLDIHQRIDDAFQAVDNPQSFLITGVACDLKGDVPVLPSHFGEAFTGYASLGVGTPDDRSVWVYCSSTPVGSGYTTNARLNTPNLRITHTTSGFARIDANGDVTGSALTSSDITTALGFTPTSNTGTVTSVQVQATSPVQSSTSTASTTTLNTTISLASAYGDTQNPYGAKQANTILAGPASGNAANPSFRTLVMGDLPIDAQTITITGTAASLTTDEIITFTGDYAQMSIDYIMDSIIHLAYNAGKRIQLLLTISGQSILLPFSYEFSYIAVFSLKLDEMGEGVIAALKHSDASTTPATSATAKISTSHYAVLSNVSTEITLSTSEQPLYTDLTNEITSTIKLPATNPWGDDSKLLPQTLTESGVVTVDMTNHNYYYNFYISQRVTTTSVTIANIIQNNLGNKVYFKINNSSGSSASVSISGTNLKGGGSINIPANTLIECSVIVTYGNSNSSYWGILTHTDAITV